MGRTLTQGRRAKNRRRVHWQSLEQMTEREHELEPPGLPHWDEQMHEASVSLEKLWEEE